MKNNLKRAIILGLAGSMTLTNLSALAVSPQTSTIVENEKQNDNAFVAEDFSYDGHTVTGFSESGYEKLKLNKHVVIPEVSSENFIVESIGWRAFKITSPDQESIESIEFPESISNIYGEAFSGNKIKSVKLPQLMNNIGANAFKDCPIEYINPILCSQINEGAFNGNQLKEIILIDGVRIIGQNAFKQSPEASKLEKLYLSNDLVSIGSHAFANSLLNEVRLPKSVENLDPNSFAKDISTLGPVKLYSINESQLEFNKNNDLNVQNIILADKTLSDQYELTQLIIDSDPTATDSSSIKDSAIIKTYLTIRNIKDAKILGGYKVDERSDYVQKIVHLTFKDESERFLVNSIILDKLLPDYPNNPRPNYPHTLQDDNRSIVDIYEERLEPWDPDNFIIEKVEGEKDNYKGSPDRIIIRGFSDKGWERALTDANLVIPAYDQEGNRISLISESAFSGHESKLPYENLIKTLSFDKNFKGSNLEISRSAFDGSGLEMVQLPEGLKSVGYFTFAKNKLNEIYLPSTLEYLDGFAFKDNDNITIYSLYNKHKKFEYEFEKDRLIVSPADRYKLLESIDKAESMSITGYNDEDIESFKNAILEAQKILYNFDSSQDQIDKANSDLNKAIKDLQDSNPKTTELKQMISDYKEINTFLYTKDSLKEFNALIESVEGKLSADLSREDLIKLQKSLINGFETLVKVQIPEYEQNDFEYSRSEITGLSKSGREKLKINRNLVLPNYSPDGYAITYIKDLAFLYGSCPDNRYGETPSIDYKIESVKLPKYLKFIGNSSFANNKLKEINLPESLTNIDYHAFENNNIRSLKLPSNLIELRQNAFKNNEIRELIINERLGSIQGEVFAGNKPLEKLVIPDNIVSIGTKAFEDCQIKEMVLGSNLKDIGSEAFKGNQLSSLTIPDELQWIGQGAFEQDFNASFLKELKLGKNLKGIGYKAFANGKIESAKLPPKLITLAYNAFTGNTDDNGNPIVVKLLSTNEDQLELNLPKSKENHLIVFDGQEDDKKEEKEKGPEEKDQSSNEDDDKGDTESDNKNIIEDKDNSESPNEDKDLESKEKGENSKPYPKDNKSSQGDNPALDPGIISENLDKKIQAQDKDINSEKSTNKIKDQDSLNKTLAKKRNDLSQITSRIAGQNRIETAVNLSKENFAKAQTVILAASDNYADALAASALASSNKAPILLTGKGSIEEVVKAEIDRLGAKNVILVGGDKAISPSTLDMLGQSYNTNRIAGDDRYQTSALVALEIAKTRGKVDTALIASGEVFADALAASSYAAKENMPILLVKKDEAPDVIKETIAKIGVEKLIYLGGENTISEKVKDDLGLESETIKGKDRFETSVKIAERFYENPKELILASGEVFADSLVAGPIGGMKNSPILLSGKKEIPQVLEDYIKDKNLKQILLIGGENTINLK